MIIKFTRFNFSHPEKSAKIISNKLKINIYHTRVFARSFVVGLEIFGKFSRGLTGSPLVILTVLPLIGLPVTIFPSEFVEVSLVYVE